MAIEEHVELIAQGASVWNEWREASPKSSPDLSGADLGGAQLAGADLSEAKLSLANLSLVDLSEARLRGADISGVDFLLANLSGADMAMAYAARANFSQSSLAGADLSYANLCEANLARCDLSMAVLDNADLSRSDMTNVYAGGATFRGADLCEADLGSADLSRSDLMGAQVDAAILGLTVFGDNDLSGVEGLDAVRHLGPSVFGTGTIARCQGNVSPGFLARAGVGATVAAREGGVVERPYCFISYCEADSELARKIHGDLQAEGLACWLAPEGLKGEGRFQRVFRELPASRVRLLMLASADVLSCDWVVQEVEMALAAETSSEDRTVLTPVCVDDAGMEAEWVDDLRMTRLVCDVRGWAIDEERYQAAVAEIMEELRG